MDVGTLDSGERSLAFGLLVSYLVENPKHRFSCDAAQICLLALHSVVEIIVAKSR